MMGVCVPRCFISPFESPAERLLFVRNVRILRIIVIKVWIVCEVPIGVVAGIGKGFADGDDADAELSGNRMVVFTHVGVHGRLVIFAGVFLCVIGSVGPRLVDHYFCIGGMFLD